MHRHRKSLSEIMPDVAREMEERRLRRTLQFGPAMSMKWFILLYGSVILICIVFLKYFPFVLVWMAGYSLTWPRISKVKSTPWSLIVLGLSVCATTLLIAEVGHLLECGGIVHR